MSEEFFDKYYRKGGDYLIPNDIFNNFLSEYEELQQENKELKQKLNWIAFGDDSELALRYLRKIGYVDFDEERKVYINKHNNEPFWFADEKEKDYYLNDDELDEYTKQLEHQLQQRNEVIKEAREMLENYQNNIYSKNARKYLDDDIEKTIDILKK